MKYKVIFGLAALAFGFTACDDVEDSNSLPQSNPQLDMVAATNVTLTQEAAAVNLNDLNGQDQTVTIAKVTNGTDWPEGFDSNVPYMQISKDNTFASFESIPATMGAEGDVIVNPDDWQEVELNLWGKNPAAREVYVRFPVFAVNGSQSIRMGGENYWYGSFPVTVTPVDLFNGNVIEEKYYLIGSFNNFATKDAKEFRHNSNGDVYDDPTFTITVTAENAEGWVIIPESVYASGNVPTTAGTSWGGAQAGTTATEGTLVANEAGQIANAIEFPAAGPYIININMEAHTYSFQQAYEALWVPGDANGWSFGSTTLTTSDYTNYSGYQALSGGFKFTPAPDWNQGDWGVGAEDGALSKGGGNLSAPAAGLYWINVNLTELKYSLTEIATIGLIGDGTPGGWDASTALTPSADFLSWSGVVELKDGEFKFRANDGWDINLGGSIDDLTQNGANIKTPGAGKYLITLDLSAQPYSCSLQAQ